MSKKLTEFQKEANTLIDKFDRSDLDSQMFQCTMESEKLKTDSQEHIEELVKIITEWQDQSAEIRLQAETSMNEENHRNRMEALQEELQRIKTDIERENLTIRELSDESDSLTAQLQDFPVEVHQVTDPAHIKAAEKQRLEIELYRSLLGVHITSTEQDILSVFLSGKDQDIATFSCSFEGRHISEENREALWNRISANLPNTTP
ncbi:hypothetical protein BLNAU_22917 [Blattamonas nauphoetae]|uniref:Kinetochore protein Spc24 n=1 Tax=Blattamonas nauphoetae TaxID=2049346 RepID=A0ABQ9WVV2_9EUKA|nr:hypothetical protein BLNAU_22917 [Blattamonas nauphoetae]